MLKLQADERWEDNLQHFSQTNYGRSLEELWQNYGRTMGKLWVKLWVKL